jgi:hypothetical protein
MIDGSVITIIPCEKSVSVAFNLSQVRKLDLRTCFGQSNMYLSSIAFCRLILVETLRAVISVLPCQAWGKIVVTTDISVSSFEVLLRIFEGDLAVAFSKQRSLVIVLPLESIGATLLIAFDIR